MKKLLCVLLSVMLLPLILSGCGSESKTTDEMFALDTFITFTVYGDEKTAKITIEECKSEITRLENMLSATIENTDVYNINHSNGEAVSVSSETAEILKKSIKLSQSCGGAFDISIYPLVKLWGFDTKDYRVPSDIEIADTLKFVDFSEIEISDDNTVSIKDGMSIDLGAVAKGYIGERLYYIMKEKKISRGIINLGGMVITCNNDSACEDFTIGVEYPGTGEVFATFSSDEKFTVTSGAYQRYFEENGERYHHIISPFNGKPSDSDISSVTLITDSGVSGDALSTAFFVLGVDKTLDYLKTHKGLSGDSFEFIILNSNKDEAYISSDLFDGGFKLENSFQDKIKVKVIDIH